MQSIPGPPSLLCGEHVREGTVKLLHLFGVVHSGYEFLCSDIHCGKLG